jgi:RNA-directed DNA polymerase
LTQAKPFPITKRQVWEAYKRVKANHGGAGVDGQSLGEFAEDLEDNLYKLWNRLASGSYLPPPVRRVEIPKAGGGVRPLGIPTVADRIAQTVLKHALEPELERYFHPDSYGYRPDKSAHQAIGAARQRCWQCDWVVDLDIKGFFDTIDHDRLMRAVRHHTTEPWVLLYTERWLKAPVQRPDGTLQERDRGTPQGGVASPLLANLFLHYVFDAWMQRHYPHIPFERSADDGLCHCRTLEEAEDLKVALERRFAECRLELHPEKTKIVYCKDDDRRLEYPCTSFDFLGYTFRPRRSKNRWGNYFINFSPAISNRAAKAIRHEIRRWKLPLRSDKDLEDLARMFNTVIRGWINYYGAFYTSALYPTLS